MWKIIKWTWKLECSELRVREQSGVWHPGPENGTLNGVFLTTHTHTYVCSTSTIYEWIYFTSGHCNLPSAVARPLPVSGGPGWSKMGLIYTGYVALHIRAMNIFLLLLLPFTHTHVSFGALPWIFLFHRWSSSSFARRGLKWSIFFHRLRSSAKRTI